MKSFRVRFAKQIVAEIMQPTRPSKKVIILCLGLPSMPGKAKIMEFWARKGFNVVQPRFRGTWESGGIFLKDSPLKDIEDIIEGLQRKLVIFSSEEKISIEPEKIFVIGISFGGAAALLSASLTKVTKVVAISPVIDWHVEGKKENLNFLNKYLKFSFGESYRYLDKDWKKLSRGTFFSPIYKTKDIPGKKVLIYQAIDDEIVSYKPAVKFTKLTGSTLKLYKRGGHFSSSLCIKKKIVQELTTFFKE